MMQQQRCGFSNYAQWSDPRGILQTVEKPPVDISVPVRFGETYEAPRRLDSDVIYLLAPFYLNSLTSTWHKLWLQTLMAPRQRTTKSSG